MEAVRGLAPLCSLAPGKKGTPVVTRREMGGLDFLWGLYVAVTRHASCMLLCRLVFQICDHQVMPVWGCLTRQSSRPREPGPTAQGLSSSPSQQGCRWTVELASPFAGSVIWTSLLVSLDLDFSFSEILE